MFGMKLRRSLVEGGAGPWLRLTLDVAVPPQVLRVLESEPSGPFSGLTVQFRTGAGQSGFVGLTRPAAALFRLGLRGLAVQLSRRFVRRRFR
jgi:hypothetical protein